MIILINILKVKYPKKLRCKLKMNMQMVIIYILFNVINLEEIKFSCEVYKENYAGKV